MNGLRKHIKGSQAQKDKHCTISLICGASFEVLIDMLNLRVEATQLQSGHNGEQPEQCVRGCTLGVGRFKEGWGEEEEGRVWKESLRK